MSSKKGTDTQPVNGKSLTKDTYTYPPEDDIYEKLEEAADADPENSARQKVDTQQHTAAELAAKQYPENELDVPGAELDDDMEMTGGEDEENNYYSLGHDNHDKFDEREGA